jgi:NAD(P)-dependent dehydrogenase (short-subunit alcohol dehydrogenase family)
VVLVSGGTQGVGAAIARAAAREGAAVAVSGRRVDVGTGFVEQLRRSGAQAEFWAADLADVAQAQDTVQRTIERFGRIDGLVNCAGLTTRGTLTDTTPELFDEHIAINLRAPFFLMQAAVRDMVARDAPGTIVNIVTMSAHGGQPYLAPYVSAKAGLMGLIRNAAHAHRFDRIRINGINIGWTETPAEHAIQRSAHDADDDWAERAGEALPMGRLARPDDVAELAVLLLSDRSGVVTGSVIDWDQHVVGAYD